MQHIPQYNDKEEAKTMRFIRGLRPEISKYLVTQGLNASFVEREELCTKPDPIPDGCERFRALGPK